MTLYQTDLGFANLNLNPKAFNNRFSPVFKVDALGRLRRSLIGFQSEAPIGVVSRWLKVEVNTCLMLDQSSVDPESSNMRFRICETLISSPEISLELRAEREILEIVGIESRFPQMIPLFHCGTINGGDCRNYGEMELLMHYSITTLWIEGCDHSAS